MICPFMSYRVTIAARDCHKKNCAIWDEERGCCSLKKQPITATTIGPIHDTTPVVPYIPYVKTSMPIDPQRPGYVTCHSPETLND